MIYRIKHPEHSGVAKMLTTAEGMPITLYIDGAALIPLLAQRLASPWNEALEAALRAEGYQLTVEREQSTHDRIALWCKLYKQAKGLPYRISASDSGKMKKLQVTEPLLRYYLDDNRADKAGAAGWLWKGKQSIGNLARYWNEVRTAMVAPEPSRHPDHWDRAHLAKLDPSGISEYYRHLKAIGLVPKHHRDGSIMDFVPAPK